MAELGVDFGSVEAGPLRDRLGGIFKRFEVGGGIAVAPCVVVDDGQPVEQQRLELGLHDGTMAESARARNCGIDARRIDR